MKIISIITIFTLVITLNSCCQLGLGSCKMSFHTKYSVLNSSDQDVMMGWHLRIVPLSNSGLNTPDDSFLIAKGEQLVLYESNWVEGTGKGALSSNPFPPSSDYESPYISVDIKHRSGRIVDVCLGDSARCLNGKNNPLYESNYELVRSVDNKKEERKEYLFTLQ